MFTVGFCMGGRHSWLSAAGGHGLAGAIGFYGRTGEGQDGSPGPVQRAPEMACPILALQAGDDKNITAEDNAAFEEALRAAGVPHELVTYPGRAAQLLRPQARRLRRRLRRRLAARAHLHRGERLVAGRSTRPGRAQSRMAAPAATKRIASARASTTSAEAFDAGREVVRVDVPAVRRDGAELKTCSATEKRRRPSRPKAASEPSMCSASSSSPLLTKKSASRSICFSRHVFVSTIETPSRRVAVLRVVPTAERDAAGPSQAPNRSEPRVSASGRRLAACGSGRPWCAGRPRRRARRGHRRRKRATWTGSAISARPAGRSTCPGEMRETLTTFTAPDGRMTPTSTGPIWRRVSVG